jgi:hypothetical protein
MPIDHTRFYVEQMVVDLRIIDTLRAPIALKKAAQDQ